MGENKKKWCMDNVEVRGKGAGKRRPGRPAKAVRKSETLMVRVTLPELMAIREKARLAGVTTSEWFRRAAREAQVVPRLSPEEMGYLRSLSGLANNLNQLTKLAHTSGLLGISVACRRLLEETGSLMDKLAGDDR